MNTSLSWKKGLFKSSYEIFAGDISVGKLKPDSWNSQGNGYFKGKEFKFETKGFFNQETRIINPADNSVIGNITYNSWKTKATIEYGSKTFSWKYDNGWNTKWSLSGTEGIALEYHGSFTEGEVKVYNYDDLLILTGLYISNYFWQISSVIIMSAIIPVVLSGFNLNF
jgi:hypothetical protein